jgi:hypothetical protein
LSLARACWRSLRTLSSSSRWASRLLCCTSNCAAGRRCPFRHWPAGAGFR